MSPVDLIKSFSPKGIADAAKLEPSEWEQGVIRIVIVFLVAAYLSTSATFGHERAIAIGVLYAVASYLVFSLIMLASFVRWPGPNHIRRSITLVADLGMTTYAAYRGGELLAPCFAIYLWLILGYGIRYGQRYLVAATFLGTCGYLSVVMTHPFWKPHFNISMGMFLALVVIPMFVSMLLRKLERGKREAEVAREEAVLATNAKSTFVANMSHEMRTPLTGIIGMAEILEASDQTRTEHRDHIRTIYVSAQILLGLIEDVLDFSKIEAGKLMLDAQEFDLHNVLSETMITVRPRADKKNLALSLHTAPEIPFMLAGDALRLSQVLMNLLGNAVKFTAIGHVSLEVTLQQLTDSEAQIRFEISDTGIGIAQQHLETIFDNFTQADGTITREFGGTGLGVTIARHIVELMGGEIGVRSAPGIGSTFWFQVPFQRADRVQSTQARNPFSAHRVLLVTQDIELAKFLEQTVAEWGMQHKLVCSSVDALAELLRSARTPDAYSLAIVDAVNIGCTPSKLANQILVNGVIANTELLLIAPSGQQAAQLDPLRRYTSIVRTPIAKGVLFNSIHAGLVRELYSSDISKLSDQMGISRDSPTLKLLVAEDSVTTQKVLKLFLEQAGHDVTIVDDGAAALTALADRSFDAVIVDMQMPRVSGLDVIQNYRYGLDPEGNVPFIVLTANATKETQAECDVAGADAYLTKPIKAQLLLDTLSEAVAKRVPVDSPAPDTSATPTLSSEVLDLETLDQLMLFGAGGEFVQTLLPQFRHDIESDLDSILFACEAGSFELVRNAAHGLQGTAYGLGGRALGDAAGELETLSLVDLEEVWPHKIETLRVLYERTVVELHAITSGQSLAVTDDQPHL